MPRFYACDHCGRSGATLGVYYPGRDVRNPPVRLCQSMHGNPIEPNCYHLVTELGEELGIRRTTPILETDRHAPVVEAVAIRFEENTSTGTINPHTVRTPVTEHPLVGQVVMNETPELRDNEKGKGVDDPYGATLKPLVDPNSAEGQAIADAAAAEAAADINLPGGLGSVGAPGLSGGLGGDPQRGFTGGSIPARYPHGPVGDGSGTGGNGDFDDTDPANMRPLQEGEPASEGAVGTLTDEHGPARSPAQIAADAQAKADEEEKAKRPPAKKAPAKKAAAKPASKDEKSGD